MRAVNPQKLKNQKFPDKLARQRRRRFTLKAAGLTAAAVAIIGALVWGLFFSGWFWIKSVAVTGLTPDHASAIQSAIDTQLSKKFLGIPYGRNILLFSDGFTTNLKAQFGFLDGISITKTLPHVLSVSGTEKQVYGIWCFDPPTGTCNYFDKKGNLWGDAVRSTGFLVLNVDDMRNLASAGTTAPFLDGIEEVNDYFKQKGFSMDGITIPTGSYTEFDVSTADYPVKFSTDSSLSQQLDVFKIFKEQKIDTGQVQPQYLDLRYDGRVYFK